MLTSCSLSDHELTLVIPAYNEERRLPTTLQAIARYLDQWGVDYRVIVVNDGSQDGTATVTDALGSRFSTITQKNRGKGAAVRNGLLAATGSVVAFTDADLPFDLAALRAAYEAIESQQSDAVFGSRAMTTSKNHARRPMARVVASHLFRIIVQAIASPKVKDTQCGLKVFSRSAAQTIFSRSTIDGFAFDVEVVFLADRLKLRIHELSVVLVNEHGSTISLARSAVPMLLDLIRIRWKKLTGAYGLSTDRVCVVRETAPVVTAFETMSESTAFATEVNDE